MSPRATPGCAGRRRGARRGWTRWCPCGSMHRPEHSQRRPAGAGRSSCAASWDARRTVDLGPDRQGVAHVSLLEALQESWPPAEDAPVNGYRRMALASTRPLVAMSLRVQRWTRPRRGRRQGPVRAVDARSPGPRGPGWRRARPRDGASAALVEALATGQIARCRVRAGPSGHRSGSCRASAPSASTRPTSRWSWAAPWSSSGWPSRTCVPPSVPDLQAHLAAWAIAGRARARWARSSGPTTGPRAPLAFLTQWLPDARDGWDWCVQDLLEHLDHAGRLPRRLPARQASPGDLGRLTAGLHAALATPIGGRSRHPVEAGGPGDHRSLDGRCPGRAGDRAPAGATGDRPELGIGSTGLRERIGRMGGYPGDPRPAHPRRSACGPGAQLAARSGIIDLDDDISVDSAARGRPLPVARDVAQMTCSLDHVGRLADRRTGGGTATAIERWIDGRPGRLPGRVPRRRSRRAGSRELSMSGCWSRSPPSASAGSWSTRRGSCPAGSTPRWARCAERSRCEAAVRRRAVRGGRPRSDAGRRGAMAGGRGRGRAARCEAVAAAAHGERRGQARCVSESGHRGPAESNGRAWPRRLVPDALTR